MERTIRVCFTDDGEADEPLAVKEGIARQCWLDGEFREAQQREVRVERISRAVGVVVLQHELDIVDSLTKDNLLDAMVALDYLQFDTDTIFTPSSKQSLLWRIHRHVVHGGWLRDEQLANSLLDSFGRYAFIARFIHRHKDIRAGLLPALRKRPDIIRAQWRRCERGEAEDDVIKAAVSLVGTLGDELSYGRIDMPCHELGTFITKATGRSSLAYAHGAIFEQDIFASSASSTTQPFDDEKRGDIEFGTIGVEVAGLRQFGPPFPSDPPADALRDGDGKMCDVRGCVSLEVPCGAAEGTTATQAAYGDSQPSLSIRLHDSPVINADTGIEMGKKGPSVDRFGISVLGAKAFSCFWEANISAEALLRQGKGEARLEEVQMKLTVRFFPMRTLALHYLRLCANDGHWEGVTLMARSIHRDIALKLVSCLAHASQYRVPLTLLFASAIQDVGDPEYDRIAPKMTADAIRKSFSVLPALLPILPTLPQAVQTAFEDGLKGALMEAIDTEADDSFKQLYNAFINSATKEAADRRRLEAENERLREENARLKEQDRRGTKRSRDEMDGQQQEGEGGADQQDMKMTT
ncbi:unnamed protein product [Vitrella brassicaformis CCMP3155]|uniref:Uncharacterized protein n=1 Tax=Vitrella brassicaformis (strain CCMP3155) TaxID=1169540 RepID=A0A0G4FWK6_VITBC|nr:unnamed protein product [Vitrella brassicaformis CCMP3155]|eukprot:CEM19609.1 unnamed protein product [Vitrella brassicaformis CCMP3155]